MKPCQRLAYAIIYKALRDMRCQRRRVEVLAFLCSEWFDQLCCGAGIDAERLRSKAVAMGH